MFTGSQSAQVSTQRGSLVWFLRNAVYSHVGIEGEGGRGVDLESGDALVPGLFWDHLLPLKGPEDVVPCWSIFSWKWWGGGTLENSGLTQIKQMSLSWDF